jgi:hypothetical protein
MALNYNESDLQPTIRNTLTDKIEEEQFLKDTEKSLI